MTYLNLRASTKLSSSNLDLLIVPIFSREEIKTLKPFVSEMELINLIQSDFKNTPGSILVTHAPQSNFKRLMLLGLGERKNFSHASLRKAIQTAMLQVNRSDWSNIELAINHLDEKYLEAIAFAAVFGSYRFDYYKQDAKKDTKNLTLLVKNNNSKAKQMIENGAAIANAVNNSRDLANHPGNVATPKHLAAHAKTLSQQYKFKCKVLGPAEIKKEGMGLLAGVSKGSDEPAQFIILEYGNVGRSGSPKDQPIVLIGKGLTFDSGGVSIKPAEKMEEMKFDMAGGATVIGIFEAAAALKLRTHLIGLIPSSENLISGSALKPGDILKSLGGKTVEVINTDAEGRLILADAIDFAKKYYKPKLMIDFATLTGAVIAALGDEYAGIMKNTTIYDASLAAASKTCGEKYWILPLVEEYKEQVKSAVADVKNVGEKGFAGAINGGLFLESFAGNSPWIHMDTAGTAWTAQPKNFLPVGATGWGVYLTINFLKNLK